MFKVHSTNLRTLRSSDEDFVLKDGVVLANRAGFEISCRCPENYKHLILECIQHGWIKPIATVYDWELTYSRLKNE